DTLRTDALRLYSDSGTSAPNLETLAGDSIVFTNAYTPGPWTLPSISTFLTGLSPDAHGARYHKDRLPSNVRMLAQRFGEAGYVTAGIGRNIFIRMNMERGFEHFDFYPKKESEELFGETVWEETYGDPQPGDIDTPEIARRAIRWLDANADKGFFFWVHFFDPHYPYAPPGKYRPKRRPPAGMGYSFHELKRVRGGYLMPTAKQREWIRELYLGEVRYVDAYAGRVLNHLRKLGLYDDALILFASDHGDEFWEHGGFEHGHAIHDELLRVPMMVKLPGGAKPVERIDTRASLTMLAPTLLELAGIAFDPADMSEPSLAPVLRGEEPAAERTIFASGNLFYDKKEAVIFDGMKYIHREVPEREELFDLAADPGETTNIALAHPDLIERARGLLADHARAEKIRRSEMRIRQSAHKALDESAAEAMRSLGYLQ
ncbi:sulfatase-like hydrolase/transferase, partial [bacterium]|nr:sulfatase-like hydrolase/transferase [bacterium]